MGEKEACAKIRIFQRKPKKKKGEDPSYRWGNMSEEVFGLSDGSPKETIPGLESIGEARLTKKSLR